MTALRKLSGLFSRSSNLKQAVGILFVTVLISNVLGLLRNVIIANRVGVAYGSIAPLDTYYAAFVLPDLLYNILIVGALSSAILPLLVKIETEQGEDQFWYAFNVLLSTGILVIIAGLVALYFLLPWGMRYFFPGFSHPELQNATQMAQVMLLSPLFFTVSQLTTSALQARKVFLAPAIAPIIYNLAIVATALLIPRLGISILVSGVIIGAVGHFLVQLPSLIKQGWHFNFEVNFKHDYIHRIMKLMVPRTLALTSTQLLLIAFYRIASTYFHGGAISIYELTDSLQTAPVLLLGNSLAMAVLPDFARHFAKSEHTEFNELIGKAIRFLLFVFLPMTVYLLLLRGPIVQIYIGLGRSIATSEVNSATLTFGYFVVSLFFQAAVLLLARAYFARGDTIRPTVFTLISLAVAWTSAVLFARHTGLEAAGLALAFSIGSSLNAILLWSNIKLPWQTLWRSSDGRQNLFVVITGTIIATLGFVIGGKIAPMLTTLFGSGVTAGLGFKALLSFIFGGTLYLLWAKLFNLEQWQLIKPTKASTEK